MMAKPVRALELPYPMVKFLIKGNNSMIKVTDTCLSSLVLVADPVANFTRLP